MRLLYVIDSLAPGGAETSLVHLTPGLITRGIEVHVLPLGARLDLRSPLLEAGAIVHTPPPPGGRAANVRAIMEEARALRPHLIHTTLFEADIAGRAAGRLLHIPSSTSLVNDSYGPSHYSESKWIRLTAARALDASTGRFASRFHALSTSIADAVSARLRLPRDHVDVVPRGRRPEDFPFRPDALRSATRRELDLDADVPVILGIGRLEPQKGFQHLLAALPAVQREHPKLVTLIAGKEGRSGESLRAQARRLGIDTRFLGHRSDVAALLAAADVFCFPSEREGFGGVLIEAMAAGCPIVATAIPTTIEVTGGCKHSVAELVSTGDRRALADSLTRTLSRDSPTATRVRTGRARFERNYTIDAITDPMVQFFERAASPMGSRRK